MNVLKANMTLTFVLLGLLMSNEARALTPIFTDDETIEIRARRFSVLSRDQSTSTQLNTRTGLGGDYDNNPVVSFALHGPYQGFETMSSINIGSFSFSETVIDTRTAYPSVFRVFNGSQQVAEFGQGLRLLGGGVIPGPGPGGLSAMSIVSHDTTDSRDVSTGGIVTAGGLGVAKSAHIGGDLAIFGQALKNNGGSWASISDKRLKKNITPVRGALERVQRLTPVSYDWKNPSLHGNEKRPAGFIAQDVGSVFPEFAIKTKCHDKDCESTQGEDINALKLTYGFDAQVVGAVKDLAQNLANLIAEAASLSRKIVSEKISARHARLKKFCIGQTCIDESTLNEMTKTNTILAGEK